MQFSGLNSAQLWRPGRRLAAVSVADLIYARLACKLSWLESQSFFLPYRRVGKAGIYNQPVRTFKAPRLPVLPPFLHYALKSL